MGYMVHKSQSNIVIDEPIDEVFNAIVKTGHTVGKVKETSKIAKYIVIRTPMRFFPPVNAATVRVSLKKIDSNQTEISFHSDSFDGTIGFGSAGKAIDAIIMGLEDRFS